MAKFVYNNIKININISSMIFELNYDYYPYVLFEDEVYAYSKSCLAKDLAKELKDLILIYQQNLFYTQ